MQLEISTDCKQGAVRAVRYNVDGDYILTCGSNKTVKLMNAKTHVRLYLQRYCKDFSRIAFMIQALLKTYLGHGDEVLDAKSTCDNGQVVSCGLDKTVILWDVSTGVPQRKWVT